MNRSMTMSCSWMDVEKQMGLLPQRLIRVRSVKWFRSRWYALRLPTIEIA
jgi:hypothetical protein